MKYTLLLLLTLTARLHAQSGGPYTIDWSTVDGGGITAVSTGGAYTLTGTIGQHDAAPPPSGGSFTLTGGFWSLVTVVQTPEAPHLALQLIDSNTKAALSWDVNASGWALEVSTDLQTWAPAPAAVVDTSTHHTVTVSAAQRMFFRLVPVPPPAVSPP